MMNSKTHCLGRLLVDLPARFNPDAEEVKPHVAEELRLNDLFITTQTDVKLETFQNMIDENWAAIMQSYERDRALFDRRPEYHQLRANCWLFAFNFKSIAYDQEVIDGVKAAQRVLINDAEGYFWDRGTLFTVRDGGYERVNQEIAAIMQCMRYRDKGEIPEPPGICMRGGFIEHHYQDNVETYAWSINLPGLTLMLRHDDELAEEPMLATYDDSVSEYAQFEDDTFSAGRVLRAHVREHDHLPAEERVTGEVEGDLFSEDGDGRFTTDIDAMWQYGGSVEPLAQPLVRAGLHVCIESDQLLQPPQIYPSRFAQKANLPSEAEYFAMWDSIVKSIRFYPGSLTPPPKAPSPVWRGPDENQRTSDRQTLDDFLKSDPRYRPLG